MKIVSYLSLLFSSIPLEKSIYNKAKKYRKEKIIKRAYKALGILRQNGKIPYITGIRKKK